MAKKPVASVTLIDPTLPIRTLTLDGVEYKLTFDYEAICQVQAELRASDSKLNLLRFFDFTNIDPISLRALFVASLRKLQPEIDLEAAKALITVRNQFDVLAAVCDAYADTFGKKEDAPADPPQPSL